MEHVGIGVVLLISAIYVVPGTFLVSVALTLLVRRIAPRIGLTDRPDGHRKLHTGATPVGGGVAVFLATAVIVLGLATASTPWRSELHNDAGQQMALLTACVAVVALGLVDDKIGIRGRHKLIGQLGVAGILVMGGLIIQRVELFGLPVDFGVFAVPITMLWLVGAMNSVNLLDGIDGLATTIGIILCTAIGILAAITGHYAVTVVAWAFASGLLGFLVFNFPPATIFLGDTGSMLIGLIVGALAIRGSLKGPGTVLMTAPLAIWTIPALDTVAAILRRKLTGRSIYATDRGHLHHRMLAMLGSNQGVLACVAVCCVATSVAGLISVFKRDDTVALVTCVAVAASLVVTGLFGRSELELLATRVRNAGLSIVSDWHSGTSRPRHTTMRLRGSQRWEPLWKHLTEAGEEQGLSRICLDLDLPATNEAYSAVWQRVTEDDLEQCWSVEVPLIVAGRRIGCLRIAGPPEDASSSGEIEQLMQLLTPTESQIVALANESLSAVHGRPLPGLSPRSPERALSVLVESHPK